MKKAIYLSRTADNPIHTGSMLKAYIDLKRIFRSALARKMGRRDSAIQQFQRNQTMQTAILFEFCTAMKHNFFRDIADMLPAEYTISADADTSHAEKITALEQEILILKAEKEVLLRAMRE